MVDEQKTGLPVKGEGKTFPTGMSKEKLYSMAQMGYTQFKYGQFKKAESIFKTLVSVAPSEGYFHLALGSCYQKQKKYELAIAHFNKALETNPRDIPALVNRGESLLKIGSKMEGMMDLKRAIQLDPDKRNPSSMRARSLVVALIRSEKMR